MARLALGSVFCVLAIQSAIGAEPTAPSAQSARKQIEAILQAPAELDFGKRTTVTVGELLELTHKRHHLSIRFDTQSLTNLYGLGGSRGSGNAVANWWSNSRPTLITNTVPGRSLVDISPPMPSTHYYAPADATGASPPVDSPVASEQLADQIRRGLLGGELQHYSIDVKVMEGTCWLSGTVRDPKQMSTAVKIASEVPGIAKVVNGLKTVGPAPIADTHSGAVASAPDAASTAGYPSTGYPAPVGTTASDAVGPQSPPQGSVASAPAVSQPSGTPVPPSMPVEESATFPEFLDRAKKIEVSVATVDGRSITVATVLRLALDAFPDADGTNSTGMPIALSDASKLDFLVEDDGILITTRLEALTRKETRVYCVKNLKKTDARELAAVICQSVRPWSWRSRIDELGEQLKVSVRSIPPTMLASIVKSATDDASDETRTVIAVAEKAGSSASETAKPAETIANPSDDTQQAAMIANAVANGLVTLAQSSLTTLEMIHFADPPTGSIRVLPGKLIVTQSQAAHREIAVLLDQLGDE